MVGSGAVHQAAQQTQPAAPGPSRRAVLLSGAAAGGVLLLPACTGDDEPPGPPPPPHPDIVLADEAAARERRLLEAYDLALQRRPDLAPLLGALRAEHADHVAALGVPEVEPTPSASLGSPATPQAAPAETGPAAATASPAPPPLLPADPAAVPAALADLERRTAAVHSDAVLRAGRGLAVVLASAAASESSHAVALL